MLFCAKMKNEEAIIITGAQKFSNYKGYAMDWEFAGAFEDKTPLDIEKKTMNNHIIAIDAIPHASRFQFQQEVIKREVLKAYCGFHQLDKEQTPMTGNRFIVATGNWGCGAFGGNKQLKAVQQIIAASENDVNLMYYTYKRKDDTLVNLNFTDELKEFVALCHENDVSVSELYSGMLQLATGDELPTGPVQKHVFAEIKQFIAKNREKGQPKQQQIPITHEVS